MTQIFFFEPNGRTNTAKYVGNIVRPSDKVFTSRCSHYPKGIELDVFRGYRESESLKKLYLYLAGWIRIIGVVSKNAILHFHWLKLSPLDFLFLKLLKIKGVKLVCTVHNLLPHEPSFYDHYFYRYIYKISDHLIFHTEGILKEFRTKFFKPKKLKIINHYFENVQIEIEKTKSNHLLFFGNIRPYKGLELLLDAMRQLDDNENWTLTIAGKPEYDISQLLKRAQSDARVIWRTEYISNDEVDDLFNSCGIIILPYLKIDTSGLLYLAKSYGKVIIAPDMGIFSEFIDHRNNGLLFKPHDAADLKTQISFALDQINYNRMEKVISEELPSDSVADFRRMHRELYNKISND
jgi:glycosyltransferase involved in cell wall biosynthesis